MRTVVLVVGLILAGCASQAEPRPKQVVATGDIRAEIVAASVYTYKGRCPCPYSQEGACKGKSAHERGGGAEPKCYRSKVTAEEIKRWRELVKDSAVRSTPE